MRSGSARGRQRKQCAMWSTCLSRSRGRDLDPEVGPEQCRKLYTVEPAASNNSRYLENAERTDAVGFKNPSNWDIFCEIRVPSPTSPTAQLRPRRRLGPPSHPPSCQRSSGSGDRSRKLRRGRRIGLSPCNAGVWHDLLHRKRDRESAETPTPSSRASKPESAFRRRLRGEGRPPEAWRRTKDITTGMILRNSEPVSQQEIRPAVGEGRAQKMRLLPAPRRYPLPRIA